MDILRNFDAGAENGDSVLLQVDRILSCLSHRANFFATPQVKRSSGGITYFGDDTWGKVFSTVFSRADGVTSFDVLDTQFVDFNVTRNTIRELRHANDWNLSVWHFLGVDHAGHISGIDSEIMCTPILV